MNKSIITIVSWLAIGSSFAQTIYESPCVEDGKTFQLTIPEGYFKVKDFDPTLAVYTTVESFDVSSDDPLEIPIGTIMIMYQAKSNRSMNWYLEEFERGSTESGVNLEPTVKPEIVKVNGRDMLFSFFKGNVRGVPVNEMYFAVFSYGGQVAIVGYNASDQLKESMSTEEFKEVLALMKEIDTDKEDGFNNGILVEMGGINEDLFETKLSNYFIVPVSDDHWSTNWDKSRHLFDEYLYKEESGSVQIFSGGNLSDYQGKEQIEQAIQLVLDAENKPTLTFKSKSSSEYYNFKQYTILGAGSIKLVYTTEIENELVFFLVDEGSNPVSDFKAAAQNLIMQIEFMSYDDPRIKTSPVTPIEE